MTLLSHLSIRTRIFGLVLTAAIGLTAVLIITDRIGSEYDINGPLYRKLMLRKSIMGEYTPSSLAATDAMLKLSLLMTARDPVEVPKILEHYRRYRQNYRDRQDFVKKDFFDGPVKRSLEKEVFPPADQIFRIADEEYLPLIAKGDYEGATKLLFAKMRPLYLEHRIAIDRTVDLGLEITAKEEAEIEKTIDAGSRMLHGIAAATVVLLVVFGWFLARTIHQSTHELITRVKEMASGASDLTARVAVNSTDEMGQLAMGINSMIAKIQSIVGNVRQSSLQVLSAASQIAATARQQDATVNGLSSATTEVAAAVREISATGKELSSTMMEVNEKANHAATIATTGRDRLGRMEGTMHQLVDSTASISGKLATIREKADNINMVVTTITKVADQTNLLSINAAIEAEKAGEFGRGFLVVAREIRRLADQTAVATLDIENIVRLMQDAVASGVMQMDQFSDEVRTSVTRVGEISAQTGQIITEVSGLSQRFHTVNEGMRNQSTGVGQINDAMVSMTGDIRQTAASLEEFNKATAHLRSSIEQLNSEIDQFKV
jgi:methyl-accepting chemotaxis protein WspA